MYVFLFYKSLENEIWYENRSLSINLPCNFGYYYILACALCIKSTFMQRITILKLRLSRIILFLLAIKKYFNSVADKYIKLGSYILTLSIFFELSLRNYAYFI